MLPSQNFALRMSELREKLNSMLEIRDDDTEKLAERERLSNELAALEPKYRAALETESTVDLDTPENRELDRLVESANIGELYEAVLGGAQVDGAMRELQQHHGLQANMVPLRMLTEAGHEERAVTPAPSDVGQTQRPIIPYVFPQAAAAFLGIPQPSVPVGEAVYPAVTSVLSVGTPAENAAQTETTGGFSADVLTPSRLQASFFYSIEDRARFAGMDQALRRNLSDGLSDSLDKQIMAGTEGLLTGTKLPNNNVSAVTTFALYRSGVFSAIDGRYASRAGDLRIVCGTSTYQHMAGQYKATESDVSALDTLDRVTGGVMVSAHVPAVASNKQNMVIRKGMAMDAVAPIWEGITLLPDTVTKAANGQVVITGVMLHAVKILRQDGFRKQQTQHA